MKIIKIITIIAPMFFSAKSFSNLDNPFEFEEVFEKKNISAEKDTSKINIDHPNLMDSINEFDFKNNRNPRSDNNESLEGYNLILTIDGVEIYHNKETDDYVNLKIKEEDVK